MLHPGYTMMKDKEYFSAFFSFPFLYLEKLTNNGLLLSIQKDSESYHATSLLNRCWNFQKNVWFNVKCRHLRKGRSKERHGYSFQINLILLLFSRVPIAGKSERWGMWKLSIPISGPTDFNTYILDIRLHSNEAKEGSVYE